ncbi:MAG: TIM barrel protein [Gammaproteobacteria bacterium]|nr:TIM barrel protein [Gammaproteobacteria bacterium]MBU2059884.1 TIM barrel protein [Gammaproteobacteria bacterium]MBU2175861.1 TIM barrel protein [Gammaproteobacteria bacterium]MBU2247684.1 TIM barrel protein [Gammaproteobacteria bacterium]MBU2345369.1 TIM barrel protein [Gammaproteobacteria bacterium]
MKPQLPRRELLKQLAAGAAGLSVLGSGLLLSGAAAAAPSTAGVLKGNIHHSVSRWTYGDLSIEELCLLVKSLGFNAIDLVGPEDWPVLKKHGVDSSMCNGAELNLVDGWSDPKFHPELVKRYLTHIDLVAEAGYKNLICFSGNARGMDRETALQNAVKGLQQILPQAEKRGVVLQMELFNSKVDHPDYLADSSAWAIELCKRLNSNNFKLLYDIYHMQIMEGDIIRTIKDNHQYFGHYHTAGVPGRHEIDDSQELNYVAIAKAIRDTGFTGYLAQEFVPTPKTKEGRAQSLAQAIGICDV